MTLKIIGFIVRVLKLAYDTFVEKPVKVKPMRMPRPIRNLWMIGVAALGMAALIIFIRWFFRPLELPPAKTTQHGLKPGKESTVVTISETAPSKTSDDLTIISGIGQRTSQILADAGIATFKQIAAMKPDELAAILKQAGARIVNPATWPDQAAYAARGDWSGLQNYLASLKGS